jgi:DNA polymerase, archaea type
MPDRDQDMQSPPPPSGTERLLYGADPSPGIVAVELAGPNRVRTWRRVDSLTVASEEPFQPWLVAERDAPWRALPSVNSIETLAGDHPLRYLVSFSAWGGFLDAARAGRDAGEHFFRLRSPIEHSLVRSGRTLFKGMTFDDLVRLQLDIETTSLDANAPGARILMVALSASTGYEEAIADDDEAALLQRVSEQIAIIDPDVIEGHNIFNFDLPWMATRAGRVGVTLN